MGYYNSSLTKKYKFFFLKLIDWVKCYFFNVIKNPYQFKQCEMFKFFLIHIFCDISLLKTEIEDIRKYRQWQKRSMRGKINDDDR